MTRCSCCQSRLGYSPDVCSCYPEHCPKCLLCELQCECIDEATVVDADNAANSLAILPALSGTGQTVHTFRARFAFLGSYPSLDKPAKLMGTESKRGCPPIAENVWRAVTTGFAKANYLDVLAALKMYRRGRDVTRVLWAILRLAIGEVREVERLVGIAHDDKWDVILSAEIRGHPS